MAPSPTLSLEGRSEVTKTVLTVQRLAMRTVKMMDNEIYDERLEDALNELQDEAYTARSQYGKYSGEYRK